jgi:Phage integrase, N-terminal SAM-like domain
VGATKRRQAGEGGISEYLTKAGPRFLIKYPVLLEDGTKRVVLKRGFRSRRDAAAQLRVEISKAETGVWVEPSKQRLDAYLAEWICGQRLSAATLASYRKNIRLHIAPHLGEIPLARLTGAAVDAWMRTLETSGRADGQGGLSARTVRYVYTILRSALGDAVKHGRLSVNPTDRSTPPSPSATRRSTGKAPKPDPAAGEGHPPGHAARSAVEHPLGHRGQLGDDRVMGEPALTVQHVDDSKLVCSQSRSVARASATSGRNSSWPARCRAR